MRPLLRLEAEPKSGAIFGRLFLAEALTVEALIVETKSIISSTEEELQICVQRLADYRYRPVPR